MRDARIEHEFADGDYSFRLAWGELVELQEKCDAGPYVVLQRLLGVEWRMEDIVEVVRIGLIGGGLEPAKALTLTKRYVKSRPPTETLPLARAILMAGILGAPDEKVGATSGYSHEQPERGKMEFAPIYGKGAVMGMTPQDVNKMTVWQFIAAWEGYVKHHSGDDKMTEKESQDLFDWLQSQEFA